MALPKKTRNLLNDRLSVMDDEVDSFRVEDIEKDIFKSLSRFLIKELDLDKDGNIKKTVKNLKAMQRSKLTIRNILLSDAYQAKVGKYIASFNTVKTLSDEYIREL